MLQYLQIWVESITSADTRQTENGEYAKRKFQSQKKLNLGIV